MTATNTVALLVGTRKGAFIVTSDERRADWSISDIHIPGADVFHLAYDARDGMLYAAANSVVFGPDIQKSSWARRGSRAAASPGSPRTPT